MKKPNKRPPPAWQVKTARGLLKIAAAGVPVESFMLLLYAVLIAICVWAVKTGR